MEGSDWDNWIYRSGIGAKNVGRVTLESVDVQYFDATLEKLFLSWGYHQSSD